VTQACHRDRLLEARRKDITVARHQGVIKGHGLGWPSFLSKATPSLLAGLGRATRFANYERALGIHFLPILKLSSEVNGTDLKRYRWTSMLLMDATG